jgi:hypothetical protein
MFLFSLSDDLIIGVHREERCHSPAAAFLRLSDFNIKSLERSFFLSSHDFFYIFKLLVVNFSIMLCFRKMIFIFSNCHEIILWRDMVLNIAFDSLIIFILSIEEVKTCSGWVLLLKLGHRSMNKLLFEFGYCINFD